MIITIRFLVVYGILFLLTLLSPYSSRAETPLHIDNMLKAAEIKYELPNSLLQAMAEVESSGHYTAVNRDDGNEAHKRAGVKVRSYGLLQVQCATARMFKFKGKCKELLIPEINIEYGAHYIKWLLERYNNDTARALTCYNSGPNSKLCKSKLYSTYAGKILNALIRIVQ